MAAQSYELTQFRGLAVQRSTVAAPGTLLTLNNAFVETEGVIRSRPGAARINVAQTNDSLGGTNVHSHWLHGTQRYTGISTVLKRGMEAADPNIITGLNGNRISSVRMAPSVPAGNLQHSFFANGQAACRRKDDGTTTSNFGLDGPTASNVASLTPSATAGQPATTAIDSFAAAYTAQDGNGTEAAAGTPYDTSARAFTVPATKIERFRRSTGALVLSGQGDDGFIRLMLRVDNRQNLDHVEVALSLDTAAFATNYFHIRLSPFLFEADNSWQEFKFSKQKFEREKPTGGSAVNWEAVDGVQITVGANSKGAVTVSADDMRLEANTHADGTYDYKITLWNNNLKTRSNSRRLADIYSETTAVTAQVTVHRQRITVNRPADFATWDAQATHWEMWRRNVLLGDGFWHFVRRATVATASQTDDLADTALGEALLDIYHIPPASKFIFGPFDNRCFFIGMTNVTSGSGEEEAPYAFRWSESGYPESCPFTNYGLAGDPVDTIQGGCIWAESIILFTKSRVYRVRGLQGTYIASPTEAPEGTLSPYSIAPSPHGVFYKGYDGVYLFTGGTAVNISTEIEPLFRGETFTLDGEVISPIDVSTPALLEGVVGTFFESWYVMTYTTAAGQRLTLFYDIPTQKWHTRANVTAQSGWAIQRLSWEKTGATGSQADNLEAGTSDGWLMLLDSTTENSGVFTDGGATAISFTVQLKAWDTELKPSDVETDIKDIVIDALTGGQTLTVQVSFDGAAYTSVGTLSTTTRDKVYLPVNGGVGTIAFRAAVRITGSLSTARVTIFGVGTQHIPEPKRVIDTSTDYDIQGYPGEKLLQELQIEANTFSGAVTVTVEADGSNLAQTFTLNTSTRRNQVFSFTIENPIATSLRLKFDGTTEWKLYGYQFQFLKEPLRVLVLETEVIDEGYPAEKYLQELQLEANTFGGNVTVTVEADGSNLAQTFTLNTAAHRTQVFSFTIENPLATVLRLKMTAAAVFKYYKHQFVYLKEPLRVTVMETEITDEGHPAEKYLQALILDINTFGGTVNAVIEADGVDLSPTFLPNSTVRNQLVFPLLIENPLALLVRLKLTGAAVFKYYKHQFVYLKEPFRMLRLETEVTDEQWPGEKILQELQVTANTYGQDVTVTVEADGADLSPPFTLRTNFHEDQVFSFPVPHARATNLRLKMVGIGAVFKYYKHQFQYLKEPIAITAIETAVSLEEWPGPKIFRQCDVEINTRGQAVAASVLVDNLVVQTATLNNAVHSTLTITMATSPEGRAIALRLETAGTVSPPVEFLYYGHTFVNTVRLPSGVTVFDSTPQALFNGKKGWLGPRLYATVRGTATITGTLYMDNAVVATISIPAQAARASVLSLLPIGATGRIARVVLASTAAFQVFPEGSFVEAHALDSDRSAEPWRFIQ